MHHKANIYASVPYQSNAFKQPDIMKEAYKLSTSSSSPTQELKIRRSSIHVHISYKIHAHKIRAQHTVSACSTHA